MSPEAFKYARIYKEIRKRTYGTKKEQAQQLDPSKPTHLKEDFEELFEQISLELDITDFREFISELDDIPNLCELAKQFEKLAKQSSKKFSAKVVTAKSEGV